ncbi:Replication protein C N-terminal domain-containing protein [Palleronia marisminoris]|uniref:helix-turn-helix domain-containing protein n=1 Tax=Palleronia marisminoris TaxID=315423 RepID=UPI0008EB32DB|nr:helix-turn-helix domain-containing protein [Palleronia marisminoris]SFH29777.1 Replication protein C N-terminal domain-containing protein [Palleronia marisminoris]
MNSVTTAAPCAGAQETCARTVGSVFRPIPRWTLFGLIEACSRQLGLNSGDLSALRAMLSFLPLKDRGGSEIPATHDMLLVCYASNASICGRAGGIDESSLRRHVRKLIALGLLRRHDSATGKRFPLKRGGKVMDAFGLDLTPAFQAAQDLQHLADDIEARAEERRMLRTEALSLRRQALDCLASIDEATRAFLASITNLLRRKSTTVEQIVETRDRLLDILGFTQATDISPDAFEMLERPALPAGNLHEARIRAPKPGGRPDACEPDPVPAAGLPVSDGQNTRQVESTTSNIKYTSTPGPGSQRTAPVSYPEMLEKHPHVATFLPEREPSRDALLDSLRGLGLGLGLRHVPYGEIIQNLGLTELVAILDRMILKIDDIKHPQRYFEKAVLQRVTEACSSLSGPRSP